MAWTLVHCLYLTRWRRSHAGFMDSDGLFALEGMHSPGAEKTLVEIREALEYYCLNFLRPWLEEYFYQKVRWMCISLIYEAHAREA